MLPIYFILFFSAIASAFIILAVYLKFYNKKINERFQNNIKDEKPLPNMRKVTLITIISTFLVFTVIAVLITFIYQPNKTDIKPFSEGKTTFYLSPEPVSTGEISEDMFTKGLDGSITYYKSVDSIASKTAEDSEDLPAFALSMKLPSNIKEKVDGVGVSCSYIIGENVVSSVEYTYPASSGDVTWKGFANKPGEFVGRVFFYNENDDGSYNNIYEESIVINIE